MAIANLDYRVDIIFESDVQHFIMKVPWNKDFIDGEVNFGWNYLSKEWLSEAKAWRCKTADFWDWIKLLYDFFSIGERFISEEDFNIKEEREAEQVVWR